MKKLLIVVDYQIDFVNGSLGFEGAQKLDDVICRKISQYRENGDDIIFTLDTHNESYLSTQEGRNLPVEHCIKDGEGHKLFGNVAGIASEYDLFFEKPTFPSLKLGVYLKDKEYESVELCGLVSNICVISNAIIAKAALPEAEIIVDKNATDSFDKELNEKCFDIMKGLQITVIGE